MSDWETRFLGWDHFPAGLEEAEVDVFFTLAEAELEAVTRHRKPPNRLGIAIQIGYMRMTGMGLNSVEMIPQIVLSHVADQLGQPPPHLASIRALYRRRRTLHDHQEAARAVLDLRVLTEHARRQLKVHLRKVVTTRIGRMQLVLEARGWLAHNRYQQVGERGLLDLAREVRGRFEAGLREQLTKVASDDLSGRWAKELGSEHAPGVSKLEWLRAGPRSKRPKGLADHLAKLRFLKELGADRLDFGLSEAALRALAMSLRHRKASSMKAVAGLAPGDRRLRRRAGDVGERPFGQPARRKLGGIALRGAGRFGFDAGRARMGARTDAADMAQLAGSSGEHQ